MEQARRIEYLRTLGIDVWVPLGRAAGAAESPGRATESARAVAAEPRMRNGIINGIIMGPGTGNLLLVCASSDEAATALAADIARCLDSEPVWSWPAPGDSAAGVPLEQAIAERLITRVVIFGNDLLESGIDPVDRVLGSARLLRVAAIPELAGKASARKALWAELCTNHWCAPRSRF